MVQKRTGNAGKYLNEKWHAKRHEARTETFSIEEWGDIDITKYDLDTVDFDRKQKRSTYITEAHNDADGAANGGRYWGDDVIDGK